MKENNNLFSVSTSVESTCCTLGDLSRLFTILSEALEDGITLKGGEAWEQECFIRRLTTQLALVNTMQRGLDRCVNDLDAASSFLAEMSKANGEKETV